MGRLSGTSAVRKEWPACGAGKFVTIALKSSKDGAKITVAAEAADAFNALDAVFLAHGYKPEKHHTGAYVCRKITGGSGYSLHSYGVACDINWQRNPYGKKLITDMPAAMIADAKAIRTNDGVLVFRWGGDYNTNKDAMHFECLADRASLRSGIAAGSVAGVGFKATTGTAPAEAGIGATMRLTDPFTQGPGVKELQELLTCVGHEGIEVDGVFGNGTASHVSLYQSLPARGLEQDGIAGPATVKHIREACEALKAAPTPAAAVVPKDASLTVVYGGEGDKPTAELLGAAITADYVGGLDVKVPTAIVHLVGGPAIRDYDRSLAKKVVEHPGAGRAETLAGVQAYIKERNN